MIRPTIYLDYAASTPLDPRAADDMAKCLLDGEGYGNPSSSHRFGVKANTIIQRARTTLAEAFHANPDEIVFTSGATEANNLAIKGFCHAKRRRGNHVITQFSEHAAVLACCRQLEREGFDLAMAGIAGLFGGMVTLGPAWIILACLGYVGRHYQNATSSARSAAHNRKLRREQENAEQAKRREQHEWERQAPQRERARLEMAAFKREESMKQMDAQKVRINARADWEMLYQLYAPEIASRFPRTSLDEWTKKYMGDDQSPAEVETRAEQLRKLILYHLEQVKPAPKFSSLNQLANWLQDQKLQIESLPIDDRLRRVLTANLNVRNAELMQSILDHT